MQIKNGKIFVKPPAPGKNFKSIFLDMVAVGAGRKVDKNGRSPGPWTPELLAEEMSLITHNGAGVDVRSVQRWFKDNHDGINKENSGLLAEIFGCGDVRSENEWRAALAKSLVLLAATRNRTKTITPNEKALTSERLKRRGIPVNTSASSPSLHEESKQLLQRTRMAELSVGMFCGSYPLNIMILLWAFLSVLLFVAYIMGVHDVSYSPAEGLNKQVGLFWSPNWYIDRLILVPLLVFVVSNTLVSWTKRFRPSLIPDHSEPDGLTGWSQRIAQYSFSFWMIFFVSLFIIFFLQWYGSYLRPLTQNDAGGRVIDWLLIAIEKPDIMSVSEAKIVSMVANVLSGISYWFCFAGLMILYVMAIDFEEISGRSACYYDDTKRREAFDAARQIIHGVYRCAILMVLASTMIKFIAIYLMTDAETISGWILGDIYSVLELRDENWGWFDKTPSASITSFFVLFIPCAVFFLCVSRVYWTLRLQVIPTGNLSQADEGLLVVLMAKLQAEWCIWSGIILLLIINFWLIGKFSGFSILLFVSSAIAILSFFVTSRFQTNENIVCEG